jgi:hypothetical protein
MITELDQLRREVQVYESIAEKLVELSNEINNKKLSGILETLGCNIVAAGRINKSIIKSTADKLCQDIEVICVFNFNFMPTIIINRKDRECYGVYIKGRKDLGVGVGCTSVFALQDLRKNVRILAKNKKGPENNPDPK